MENEDIMLRIRKTLLVMLVVLFAVAMPLSGLAADGGQAAGLNGEGMLPDDASSAGQEGGSDAYRLPSITVTADKRLTELQKTPIALTVIGEQELEDRNMRTVQDVLNQVPNLVTSSWVGGINWTSFRGAMSVSATGASPLVIYVDGVPVDAFYHLDANLLDIERIEILRGAQSSIYGKNSLGGVINIISKRPDNTFRGKFLTYLESYEGWGASGTVSGPLKEDKLYFSLSASHDYKRGWMDSYFTNESNMERTERAKGQLLFTPSDQAEFTLYMDYTAVRDGYYPYTLGNHYSDKTTAREDDKSYTDVLNLALRAKFDFEPAIFESITTLRKEKVNYRMYGEDFMARMGMFGIGMTGDNRRKNEVTQEFRLRSPDSETGLTWLIGAYGSYADYDVFDGFQEFNYLMMPGFAENSRLQQLFRQYTTEFAPFAQIVVPVTDAFKVTAGLRWHYTHRKASIDYKPDSALQMFGYVPMHTRKSDEWNELLPKLLLSYDITKNHMVYAGVSRSFVPGGYNWGTTVATDYTYDSQTAWNYEIGAKTSWLDNRLNANLALFYTTFDDLQVMQFDPSKNNYTAHNAGKAGSYGAELDILGRLAKGLDAQVSFGYTHARYDDYKYKHLGGTDVYDENKIEFTPEYTINGSLTYRNDWGLFVMGGVRYVSKIYWEAKNEDYRKPVTTVDAKIGYESEHFEAYLYGKNIFGERYLTYYTPITDLAMVAPPQTFGVEFVYKF